MPAGHPCERRRATCGTLDDRTASGMRPAARIRLRARPGVTTLRLMDRRSISQYRIPPGASASTARRRGSREPWSSATTSAGPSTLSSVVADPARPRSTASRGRSSPPPSSNQCPGVSDWRRGSRTCQSSRRALPVATSGPSAMTVHPDRWAVPGSVGSARLSDDPPDEPFHVSPKVRLATANTDGLGSAPQPGRPGQLTWPRLPPVVRSGSARTACRGRTAWHCTRCPCARVPVARPPSVGRAASELSLCFAQ